MTKDIKLYTQQEVKKRFISDVRNIFEEASNSYDIELETWLMRDCGGASPESANIRWDMEKGAKWMKRFIMNKLYSDIKQKLNINHREQNEQSKTN